MKIPTTNRVAFYPFLRWFLVFVICSLELLLTLHFNLFTMQNIQCTSDTGNCSEPIVAELHHLQGNLFFSPSLWQTVTKIIQSDPFVSEIAVTRKFPHTVLFHIKAKQPLYAIDCSSKQLLVTQNGSLEENTQEIHLDIPIINAQESVCTAVQQAGHANLQDLKTLTAFSNQLKEQETQLNVQWLDLSLVAVRTSQQQQILLPFDQLEHSFLMYHYLVDQHQLPENWKELDLRFQKAIVKTQ